MTSAQQIWAQTSFFQIEPGEDQQTNPGRYGRSLAYWVADQLTARGQHVEEVIPEDWGWCVLLARKPYRLWVGCGNKQGDTQEWGVFVAAEPSLFQKLFSRVDTQPVVEHVQQALHEIMTQVPGVKKVWVE